MQLAQDLSACQEAWSGRMSRARVPTDSMPLRMIPPSSAEAHPPTHRQSLLVKLLRRRSADSSGGPAPLRPQVVSANNPPGRNIPTPLVPTPESNALYIQFIPEPTNDSLRFEKVVKALRPGDEPIRLVRYTERSELSITKYNRESNHKVAFMSKVVSRSHAEIWAGPQGKIYVRDTMSSSGTFLNGVRLSLSNQASEPFELNHNDLLKLGLSYVHGVDVNDNGYKCVVMRIKLSRTRNDPSTALDNSSGQQPRQVLLEPPPLPPPVPNPVNVVPSRPDPLDNETSPPAYTPFMTDTLYPGQTSHVSRSAPDPDTWRQQILPQQFTDNADRQRAPPAPKNPTRSVSFDNHPTSYANNGRDHAGARRQNGGGVEVPSMTYPGTSPTRHTIPVPTAQTQRYDTFAPRVGLRTVHETQGPGREPGIGPGPSPPPVSSNATFVPSTTVEPPSPPLTQTIRHKHGLPCINTDRPVSRGNESVSSLSLDSGLEEVRNLSGSITKMDSHPVGRGGFADIWMCLWNDGQTTRKVAVKVIHTVKNKKIHKRIRRELVVWQRLKHPHVIPLYGICTEFCPDPTVYSMVCPWMLNGTAAHYLRTQGLALTYVERLKLLSQVASGLAYLHRMQIVHGDVSGNNVLIDEDGLAMVSDFGLSRILEDCPVSICYTSTVSGNVRWAAPELFPTDEGGGITTAPALGEGTHMPNGPEATTASDVYSYASVVLEFMTGHMPYYPYCHNDGMVLLQLVQGRTPRRPAGIADCLWDFMQRSWNIEPQQRPTMNECLSTIETILFQAIRSNGGN